MRMDRITITGADDSVDHDDMIELTKRYPFVEWGILVSATHTGEPRFPSDGWMERARYYGETGVLSLSLHVCGQWVRDMLVGLTRMPYNAVSGFQRIQLNFHGADATFDPSGLVAAIDYYADRLSPSHGRQVIFQIDATKGRKYFESAIAAGATNVVPLFDASGGTGRVPEEWPLPFFYRQDETLYFGYAGGLGPENLAFHMGEIGGRVGKVSSEFTIWLDMETKVRTEDDSRLDLTKVEQCLSLAEKLARDYKFGVGALA